MHTPSGLTAPQRLIYNAIANSDRGETAEGIAETLSKRYGYVVHDGVLANMLAKMREKGHIAKDGKYYALPDKTDAVYERHIAAAQAQIVRETDRAKEFYPKMLDALEKIRPIMERGELPTGDERPSFAYTSHQFTDAIIGAKGAQSRLEHYQRLRRG